MKEQEDNSKKLRYSAIIDGAYGLVIAQNIFCFSRPIISYCNRNITSSFFCILLSIALLNFTNLIANWISSRSTSNNYSIKLMMLDVLSLVIIAIFTQFLMDCFDASSGYKFLLSDFSYFKGIFAIFYFILYFTFFIWNILTDKSSKKTRNLSKISHVSTESNVIIFLYSIVLIVVIILDFSKLTTNVPIDIMFGISLVFSFLVIIRYYKILLSNYEKIKLKASWIGGKKKYYRQMATSLRSYLPHFSKRKNGSISDYFLKQYSIINCDEKDDLIFDCSTAGYLDKLESLNHYIPYENKSLYDLGCGNATLYDWLKQKGINFSTYYGFDFSIPNDSFLLENNLKDKIIKNQDIRDKNFVIEENSVVFIGNVLCYLNHKEVKVLVEKLKKAAYVILIEPIPGFFWDKSFDNIKLYYRRKGKFKRLFCTFNLIGQATDYLYLFGDIGCIALSTCIVFENNLY